MSFLQKSAMNSKLKVDQLYNNPPPPSFEACLDVIASPLIRSLKFTGKYFEAYHYPETKQILYERFGKFESLSNGKNETQKQSFDMTKTTIISISTSTNDLRDDPQETDVMEYQDQDEGMSTEEDNFVPCLLRHSSGIADDQTLAKILRASKTSNSEPVNRYKLIGTKVPPTVSKAMQATKTSVMAKGLRGGLFYAIFITLLSWANILRCPIYIGDPRVTWVSVCGTCLYFLQIALNNSMLLYGFWNKHLFSTFFINWYLLFGDRTSRRLGLQGVPSPSSITRIVIFMWVILFLNSGSVVYVIMGGYEAGGIDIVLLIDGNRSVWSVIVTTVINTYGISGWIFPVFFIVVLCVHISEQFTHFRNVFKMHIEAAGGNFPTHFRELRERHLVMCNLTTVMDKFMKNALAIMYSINIVTVYVILYQMIASPIDEPLWTSLIFWLVSCLCVTFVLTHYASKVNDAMKSVMCELQTLQTRSTTLDQQTQLQLFLSKLEDSELGFTILGMIVVRKELIFQLFGLYLTYAFVLLQFQ